MTAETVTQCAIKSIIKLVMKGVAIILLDEAWKKMKKKVHTLNNVMRGI
mgnify:CR=1 FL=1